MARDRIGDRFAKNKKKDKLSGLSRRTMSAEDIEAEDDLINETEKVEPSKADVNPGRNDPCPCGSGKKYKKCCGGK